MWQGKKEDEEGKKELLYWSFCEVLRCTKCSFLWLRNRAGHQSPKPDVEKNINQKMEVNKDRVNRWWPRVSPQPPRQSVTTTDSQWQFTCAEIRIKQSWNEIIRIMIIWKSWTQYFEMHILIGCGCCSKNKIQGEKENIKTITKREKYILKQWEKYILRQWEKYI